jgi:hypothetical protein
MNQFSDIALSKLGLKIAALDQEIATHKREKEELLQEAATHKQVREMDHRCKHFQAFIFLTDPLLWFEQAHAAARVKLENIKSQFNQQASSFQESTTRLQAQVRPNPTHSTHMTYHDVRSSRVCMGTAVFAGGLCIRAGR